MRPSHDISAAARALPRPTLALAIALALASLPVAVLAQDASADSAGATAGATPGVADAVELDKVEVVGDRPTDYRPGASTGSTGLKLNSRETPQSVTVVTQQRIQDEDMQTVTDVVNRTTGLSVNQYETHRAGFTARGFDIANLQIDGVPTTWNPAWSSGEVQTSLALYDRVEVVRGATGLMTGAGDPSASINLIRKRADTRELAGAVEVGYGSWDQMRVTGDVSGPLSASGNVRGRAVVEFNRGDSWIDYADDEGSTLFATVEADLSPSTVLIAGVSRQETDPHGPMWGGLPYRFSDSLRVIPWDRSDTTAPKWARWNSEFTSVYAKLEHGFANGWQLRATFARGDRQADSHLLYLFGALNEDGSGMFSFPGSYITHTVQKDFGLHLQGPFALGGRTHELAFGALYSDNTFRSDSRDGLGAADVGNFLEWDGNYPEPTWTEPYLYGTSRTRQEGVYGVARWSLADALKLITGARVSNYRSRAVDIYSSPTRIDVDEEVTPYAGLVWDFSREWSAYASYTDIFQPQDAKDIDGQLLDPVVGRGAEIGLKAGLLDGRLYASAAVFRIEQDNLAQEAGTIDRGNGPEIYYRAAEGATSTGFELELAGEITDDWHVSAGYSQFKAEDASGADVNSIYPRKLVRLFTTWRLPGALDALTIGGGASWESRTYTDDPAFPVGSQRIQQDAFALVNLMARYEISPRLAAQLNIDNALDETHFGMFAAYNALTYGAPRGVNLSLRYRF